ncbi:MAG: serine/threonine protein kinase, partial [Thermoflexales bacterium]|nr:serine/threonine protein kinase [Thermoflexales bacterium]
MADYILNNRYRLLAQVASGGMAVVYKAHDLTLNRVVAVKILRENFAEDSGFRARFQSEAQAAANLAHPNIVTVYDYGQDGNRAYIVMEFVEGRDLKSVIRAESPLPMDRAIDLMAQACAALGHAHRAGLVHCDVKPQNLIVTPDGRLKVTDFGIARAISQSMPQNVETVWGTPHYFSPEQAAGEAPTPASDVYSLGVVMYEMLSGQLPFDADNHTDLAMQHLQDQPPPLTALNPAVPIQIEQIINRVMAKDPTARYRTADQFGRTLMDYRRLADQMTGLQNAVPINVGSNSTTVGAAARPIVPATP